MRDVLYTLIAGMPSTATVVKAQCQVAFGPLLSNPPEARSFIVLTAINDPHTEKMAFSFNWREDSSVIRATPGEDIRLT